MNDTLPIGVHILTWNSAKTLPRALESVRGCAEILVIDGGSADDTLALATRAGARIIPQRKEGSGPITDFAAVRNRGLAAATQPWILALDSDEVLSEELRRELHMITRTATEPAAFRVPRKYIAADGTVIEHASTYPNRRIYFFHRDAVTAWIKPVHERVQLKPKIPVRNLQGASLAPLPSVEEFKRKNLQYLRIEADRSRNDGWARWLRHRLLHTLRSRLIATARLLWIWLLPRRGKRLPLRHEMLRYWYAWKLVTMTWPGFQDSRRPRIPRT